MKKTSVLAKASRKINNFYATNVATIFFMSATTIFALVQVILYSLNIMQVNGQFIKDSNFLNWVLLAMSIFGCYCGFIGGIMLLRGSLSFLYWQTTATTTAIITQVLASMWFGAFTAAYFIFMTFMRFWAWKHDKIEEWNWSNKKVITISALYFFIVLAITYLSVIFFGDKMYAYSKWMKGRKWMYYFDATGATLNITAAFLMLFKSRWAFSLYALAKIFTITNYAEAGLIVPIVQMMLFLIMDATGFIGWSLSKHDLEPIEIPFEEYKKEIIKRNKQT